MFAGRRLLRRRSVTESMSLAPPRHAQHGGARSDATLIQEIFDSGVRRERVFSQSAGSAISRTWRESLLNGVARNRRANWTALAQRALFQIPPRRVQGPRLASRLSELLDAHSKTADDVAADK